MSVLCSPFLNCLPPFFALNIASPNRCPHYNVHHKVIPQLYAPSFSVSIYIPYCIKFLSALACRIHGGHPSSSRWRYRRQDRREECRERRCPVDCWWRTAHIARSTRSSSRYRKTSFEAFHRHTRENPFDCSSATRPARFQLSQLLVMQVCRKILNILICF